MVVGNGGEREIKLHEGGIHELLASTDKEDILDIVI